LRRLQTLVVGLAFWLLLAPGDRWTWVIVGGADSHDGCEEARLTRLDTEYLICASIEHPHMYSTPGGEEPTLGRAAARRETRR